MTLQEGNSKETNEWETLTSTGLLQCVTQVNVEVDNCSIHPHLMVRLPYNHVGNNNCFANGIREYKNKNYRKY